MPNICVNFLFLNMSELFDCDILWQRASDISSDLPTDFIVYFISIDSVVVVDT